jgi:hypothetical protein
MKAQNIQETYSQGSLPSCEVTLSPITDSCSINHTNQWGENCDAASLNEEIQYLEETFKQDIYNKANSGKSLRQKGRKDCAGDQ